MNASDITIAIPTLGRGRLLLETVRLLIDLRPAAGAILVVDQTPKHDDDVSGQLNAWAAAGTVRWLRRQTPSVPGAMNDALRAAQTGLVLFVDDDIVPGSHLAGAHAKAYDDEPEAWAVAGQVLQPGEEPAEPLRTWREAGWLAGLDFPFRSTRRAWVRNGMAGNLSVRRDRAVQIGGFDENFRGVAFRFETEFCQRLWDHGGKVLFDPAASIRHLRAADGGTRCYGRHQTSASPSHGVGDYYFALRRGSGVSRIAYMARRPVREVCTRFHLRHPWYIPVKLAGECLAFLWALRLAARGARHMDKGTLSRHS